MTIEFSKSSTWHVDFRVDGVWRGYIHKSYRHREPFYDVSVKRPDGTFESFTGHYLGRVKDRIRKALARLDAATDRSHIQE